MILSKNIVLISSLLVHRYPAFSRDLTTILDHHNVSLSLIDGTRDIWCRDYMPVRRKDGKYMLFNYDPSFLKPHWQQKQTPREDIIKMCEQLELDFIDLKDIKLDGGNVVMSSDSVIMTDVVFSENEAKKDKQKQIKLIKKLSACFESEIIIIPHQPGDILAHADGLVRFLENKTVLVNDFSSVTNNKFRESKSFLNSLFGALGSKGFNIVQVTYLPQEGRSRDGIPIATGIYINYLETENVIFLPQFGENLQDNDKEALKLFSNIFKEKGKLVASVKCTALAKEGGVLNCVLWN
ncbi:MAG TPA: agmatine deiminase family protein [Bacteroidales bacterium]|nr:agmatine deiminase family protein [Bacteroidales bacterium]